MDLKDCLVSIDAMGCQTEIAKKITEKRGNYLLALKENQENLFKATEALFAQSASARRSKLPQDDYSKEEKNTHGRDERRECRVLYLKKEVLFFPKKNWSNIYSIIRIRKENLNRSTKERTTEIRYYISDADKSAEEFNEKMRSHWEVENKLHWSLDVSMNEDKDKEWAEQSAKNFSLIRQMAIHFFKKRKIKKKCQKKAKISSNG